MQQISTSSRDYTKPTPTIGKLVSALEHAREEIAALQTRCHELSMLLEGGSSDAGSVSYQNGEREKEENVEFDVSYDRAWAAPPLSPTSMRVIAPSSPSPQLGHRPANPQVNGGYEDQQDDKQFSALRSSPQRSLDGDAYREETEIHVDFDQLTAVQARTALKASFHLIPLASTRLTLRRHELLNYQIISTQTLCLYCLGNLLSALSSFFGTCATSPLQHPSYNLKLALANLP